MEEATPIYSMFAVETASGEQFYAIQDLTGEWVSIDDEVELHETEEAVVARLKELYQQLNEAGITAGGAT